MDLLAKMAADDNPVIALLSVMVLMLTAVVTYQWKYTANNTVPKWIWDSVMPKIDNILTTQDRLLTLLDERLKK